MIRIWLPYVWALSEGMEAIGRLNPSKDRTKFDFMLEAIGAQTSLETLLQNSVFASTLRSSRPLAAQLLTELQRHTAFEGDANEKASAWHVSVLQQAYAQFKTAFLAELGTFPAYFVNQKGSHDTLTLLDQPWHMFPLDLQHKVPEAMYDVAEAGKALCYETATACGFHLFRATEAVLRRYYSHVTGGKPPPKIRNIMVYVNAMRQTKCGDEKILACIEQLAKLHRNPIAHPEVVLSIDEAIAILGMARSAVTAMLNALPIEPATTATAAVSSASGS